MQHYAQHPKETLQILLSLTAAAAAASFAFLELLLPRRRFDLEPCRDVHVRRRVERVHRGSGISIRGRRLRGRRLHQGLRPNLYAKPVVTSHLLDLNAVFLPRQARDRHRGSSKKAATGFSGDAINVQSVCGVDLTNGGASETAAVRKPAFYMSCLFCTIKDRCAKTGSGQIYTGDSQKEVFLEFPMFVPSLSW